MSYTGYTLQFLGVRMINEGYFAYTRRRAWLVRDSGLLVCIRYHPCFIVDGVVARALSSRWIDPSKVRGRLISLSFDYQRPEFLT